MATIQKVTRKSGSRFVVICRRSGHYASRTFTDPGEAARWGSRTDKAMDEGTYLPEELESEGGKSPSVKAAIAEFVRDVLPYSERNKDWQTRAMMLQWWSEKMGEASVGAIKPAHIAKLRDRLRSGESVSGVAPKPATVMKYLMALSAFFRWAVRERQWLDSNPVDRVTKPAVKNRVIRYIHPKTELPALLAAADQVDPGGTLRLIIRLAIATGIRKEKFFDIRWRDIRWEGDHAYIDRYDSKAGRDKSWKIVGEDFEALRRRSDGKRLDAFVFACFQDDGKSGYHSWRGPYERALEIAGIKGVNFHTLRHTSASYLAMSGASVPEIMDHMDQSTPAMALRYVHLMPSHVHTIADKMVGKFLGAI